MPTQTITYSGDRLVPAYNPEDAETNAVRLKPSTTFPKGCLLGELTASPGVFAPYVDGNSDGSNIAKMLLMYPCQTDAAGLITLGGTGGVSTGEEMAGNKELVAPAYRSGVFATADLPQSGAGSIDAAAVTDLGRLVQGSTATGILQLMGV